MRAKAEGFSLDDNSFLKILHRSKQTVTSTEMNCKVSQGDRSLGVAGWAKLQCIAIKDDRFVDVTCPPSLLKLGNERFCT